jgi:hypothetical protein
MEPKLARPKKSLMEHLLDGTFKPSRGYLLREPLPEQVDGVVPAMLEEASVVQALWQSSDDPGERTDLALELAEIGRRMRDAPNRGDCCAIWDKLGPIPAVVLGAADEGEELFAAVEEYQEWVDGGRDGPAPRAWIPLAGVATCGGRCAGCAAFA